MFQPSKLLPLPPSEPPSELPESLEPEPSLPSEPDEVTVVVVEPESPSEPEPEPEPDVLPLPPAEPGPEEELPLPSWPSVVGCATVAVSSGPSWPLPLVLSPDDVPWPSPASWEPVRPELDPREPSSRLIGRSTAALRSPDSVARGTAGAAT
jgi:hypothetical protein